MTRTITIILAALLSVIVAVPASAGTTDRWGCDDLADYQREIVSLIPADDLETLSDILDSDIETLRPSEFAAAADIFDAWASDMEDMPARDVPRAAEPYHEAMIDFMSLYASMFAAMSTAGVFGAMPYVDAAELANADLEDAMAYGERKCPADWPFGGGTNSGTL
jgi:hypothetical protein